MTLPDFSNPHLVATLPFMNKNSRTATQSRKLTPEEKLKAAEYLYWSARELKKAYLKQLHPEKTGVQLNEEVKRWMLYGER